MVVPSLSHDPDVPITVPLSREPVVVVAAVSVKFWLVRFARR